LPPKPFVLLLNECLFLLLLISLSTQSRNFWIHPRIFCFLNIRSTSKLVCNVASVRSPRFTIHRHHIKHTMRSIIQTGCTHVRHDCQTETCLKYSLISDTFSKTIRRYYSQFILEDNSIKATSFLKTKLEEHSE
jgi:hypothetical protein